MKTSTSATATNTKKSEENIKPEPSYLPPTSSPKPLAETTTESQDYYFEVDVDNLHSNNEDATETDQSGTTEEPIGLPIDIEGGVDPAGEISPSCLASLCG